MRDGFIAKFAAHGAEAQLIVKVREKLGSDSEELGDEPCSLLQAPLRQKISVPSLHTAQFSFSSPTGATSA
jgi:hypothetical protein